MSDISLEPWSEEDLPLLEKLLGDESMMIHLGGPESPEKIRNRHQRYLNLPETDHMFRIVAGSEPVGSIGYWKTEWGGEAVYETGWSVLPEYQGRGFASQAAQAVISLARAEDRYRFLHAFPAIDNPASNGVCRKAGFTLAGPCEVEFPVGNVLHVNDWKLDLFGGQAR